jgi:uncharacterized protein (TIGR03437 family)
VNAQGQLTPAPIEVGSGVTQVYLILYGTGIRNHQNPVSATLSNKVVALSPLTASYAGPQGVYAGEDQINILLPQSLQGFGLATMTLTADGQNTNPIQIQIQ